MSKIRHADPATAKATVEDEINFIGKGREGALFRSLAASLADVDPRLEAICQKAMAFRKQDRYPSAGALAMAT